MGLSFVGRLKQSASCHPTSEKTIEQVIQASHLRDPRARSSQPEHRWVPKLIKHASSYGQFEPLKATAGYCAGCCGLLWAAAQAAGCCAGCCAGWLAGCCEQAHAAGGCWPKLWRRSAVPPRWLQHRLQAAARLAARPAVRVGLLVTEWAAAQAGLLQTAAGCRCRLG